MGVTSSYRLCSCVPSGVEFTSEKSVTSEELCVARVRRTTIDGETNTIYSSLALCQQRSKYVRDSGRTLVTVPLTTMGWSAYKHWSPAFHLYRRSRILMDNVLLSEALIIMYRS